MKITNTLLTSALTPVLLTAATTLPAAADSFTDFEGFTTGSSVNGQGGWSATGSWDEEVIDFGGNTVWRVSNATTAGSFGDMPYAPRPGGIVADPTIDPVNGMPGEFAGESSTGATYSGFVGSFRFRSATGSAQAGASVTVSADNGTGGRQGFIDIEDSAVATSGIDLITYDVNPGDGSFTNAITLASGLSYTEWHDVRMEIDFLDGPNNDVVRYYVNGSLVHTGTSWEQYYPNVQPGNHPNGVPVQTLIYRLSGGAVPSVDGGGFLIDDVSVQLVPEPGSIALLGLGGLALIRRRRRA